MSGHSAKSTLRNARSFRAVFRQVLHLQESPRRTAAAFAVGVFIAFCPAYGFHTIMVVLATWLLGLNFIALAAGAFINNPWTVVPILGATYWAGAFLLGRSDLPPLNWHDLSFQGIYEQVLPYAIPFVVGGIALSLAGSVLAYPAAYFVLVKYRHRTPSSASEPLPPPDRVG